MNQLQSLPPEYHAQRAITLALRLAHTENALHALTSGQVDAIIDADGKAYLLRPAQEHFQKKQRRLQTLLESAADIVTVIDRGSRIISQNRAAYRLLGFEPGSMLEKSFFDFVHPEDQPQVYSAFFNVIEELRPDAFVAFRHRRLDGTYRTLEAMVSKLREVSVHQVVLISRDAKRRRSHWLAPATEEPDSSTDLVKPPPHIITSP